MPTKKQRRRRAKEQRHEWEYVVVDEEGHEVEVDPAELREEKDRERTPRDGSGGRSKAAAKGGKSAKQPVVRDRRGRPVRPVQPPSWRRSIRRSAPWTAILLVFLIWSGTRGGHNQNLAGVVALGAIYAVAFIPLVYVVDRAAYNRYLRAAGREDEIKKRRR
jgi:hypothetical protein